MAAVIPPRNELFTPDGVATLRFYEFLRDIQNQSNSSTSIIDSLNDTTAISLIFNLENRIGSGDFLTSDETGFTVDLDTLSVDMDEA